VGKLHYTLLPNLLDVKIELELLFKTVPGESDLVPIRRKAGPRHLHNPWQRTLTSTISQPLHRNDEAIADPGQSFNEFGTFGRVFERLPQLLHGGVDSMLEINEGVFRPQRRSQLLAPYHFPVRLKHH